MIFFIAKTAKVAKRINRKGRKDGKEDQSQRPQRWQRGSIAKTAKRAKIILGVNAPVTFRCVNFELGYNPGIHITIQNFALFAVFGAPGKAGLI
ncbi:MAG: hypothetical protein IPM66_17845 [Acidobacteriota bacterium]|nr:MAG: hypothetical protein IPM66_17845 [Acidobacteriota bacterium]